MIHERRWRKYNGTEVDYMSKAETLLNKKSTYTIFDEDLTITVQNKINNLIKKLVNLKIIDGNFVKYLKSDTWNFLKMNLLQKIYKPEVPLRPIVPVGFEWYQSGMSLSVE